LQQIRLMMDRPLRINPMFGNPPDVGEKKTGNAPCGSQQDRAFKTDQIEGPNLLIAQYFSTIADPLSICQPSRGRLIDCKRRQTRNMRVPQGESQEERPSS